MRSVEHHSVSLKEESGSSAPTGPSIWGDLCRKRHTYAPQPLFDSEEMRDEVLQLLPSKRNSPTSLCACSIRFCWKNVSPSNR
jgi:hypothetical protein